MIPFLDLYVSQEDQEIFTEIVIINESGNKISFLPENELKKQRMQYGIIELLKIAQEKNLFLVCSTDILLSEFDQKLETHPDFASIHLEHENNILLLHEKITGVALLDGCEAAMKMLGTVTGDDTKKRFSIDILTTIGRFSDALAEFKANFIPFSSITDAFAYAQIADIAEDKASLKLFWDFAVTQNDIIDFDTLKILLILSDKYEQRDVYIQTRDRLLQLFPQNKFVLHHLWEKSIISDNYLEAQKIASQLKDAYLTAFSAIACSPTNTWDSLIQEKEPIYHDQLYVFLSKKAYLKKAIIDSFDLIMRVNCGSKWANQRTQILMELFYGICIVKQYPDSISDTEQQQRLFNEIVREIAFLPKEIALRIRFQGMLANSKNTSLAMMLCYIISSFPIHPSLCDILKFEMVEEDDIDLEKVLSSRYATNSKNLLFIDKKRTLGVASLKVASCLLKIFSVQPPMQIQNANQIQMMLDILHIASWELKIDNDIYAAYNAVHMLCLAGYYQEARDLAETTLLFLDSQNENNETRLALKWTIIANSALLSDNNIDALFNLMFSVAVLEHHHESHQNNDKSVWLKIVRKIAIVLRENKLFEHAKSFIEAEEHFQTDKSLLTQLKHVKYSCLIEPYISECRWKDLLTIFSDIYNELANEDEKAPYLSLLVTIIHNLPLEHKSLIPKDQLEKIYIYIEQLPESLRSKLKAFNNHSSSMDDIHNAIASVAPCSNIEDFIRAMKPAQILANSAISNAYIAKDCDLFLLAVELGTIFFISEKMKSVSPSSRRDALMQAIAQERSMLNNQEQIQKHYLEERIGYTPAYNGEYLSDISLSNVQTTLHQKEAVLAFCVDRNNVKYLYISSTEKKFGALTLSSDIFRDWKSCRDSLSDTDNVNSLHNLFELAPMFGICGNDIKQLFIIPPIACFGFPFEFATPLQRVYSINILPSISWLLQHRKNSHVAIGKSAWLGSINSGDRAIEYLRGQMVDELINLGFDFCNESIPSNCSKKEITIIASHGDFLTNMLLNDGKTSFTAERFSTYFCKTKVVILICCNAGSGTYNLHWHDIDSLAEKLLSKEVACVIAPTFSINAGTAVKWLKNFLIFFNTHTVEHSALMATQFLRDDNPYTCSWGNFHVYGDGDFKCELCPTSQKYQD